MDSLTEREMSQITKQERDVGLQRLSSHFSWPEFFAERRCFHQEFVYDVAMFASACGFSWTDVIRAAGMAKDFFPKLGGLDVPELLSLLRDELSKCLLNTTPVQRQKFTDFFTNTIISKQKLYKMVVGGAVSVSIAQLHLEVQLPPTPCPLTEGTDLHEWEHQRRQAELTSLLQHKEEELKGLRGGSRVSLGDIIMPEEGELDQERLISLVRTTVSATRDQMLQTLTHEASLITDIQHIKLQQAALATGRRHDPAFTNSRQTSSKSQRHRRTKCTQ